MKTNVKSLRCCLILMTLFCLAFKSDAAQPIPTFADISYGPFPHQLLDIYIPAQTKKPGPYPVVMWFGGIWKSSKGTAGEYHILADSCAVVAVEMRSMTDATDDKVAVPISYVLLDARRAVQFVRLHAKEYNLNPDKIATGGSSQGVLPALYVACAGDKANPRSNDAVERMSTKITCVAGLIGQSSIDPKVMQEWVPGVEWGAPALGCTFAESLAKRDQLLPIISQWSPDALLSKDAPPIYFINNWGLTKPSDVKEKTYLVHSPQWAIGFQKLAQSRGATCYVQFPGHPPEKYFDEPLSKVGALSNLSAAINQS